MWWLFLIGFVSGSFFGVVIMGCMAASKIDEIMSEKRVSEMMEKEQNDSKV